jgi:hypothetical protein
MSNTNYQLKAGNQSAKKHQGVRKYQGVKKQTQIASSKNSEKDAVGVNISVL